MDNNSKKHMILSLHFTILSTILNEIQQIPTFNYILIVNFLGHKQTVSVSGQIQILNMLLSVWITDALLDFHSSLNSQLPSIQGYNFVPLLNCKLSCFDPQIGHHFANYLRQY